jgi:hypothetical protein
MAARASCPPPPRWRAPCAEANQPAWRVAALAEEVGPVLRAFVGARPADLCLRLLKGRKDKIKIHRKMAETRVPSDTYPLRGKANRAYGEISRTLVSADAAEGWPAAGFNAASASDARGADGVACPGDVTAAEGTTSRTASTNTCSGGHAVRPGPPESPQLSWPRGQVPPRPASTPRTGILASRPQTLVVPAHLEAGLTTPSPASDPD